MSESSKRPCLTCEHCVRIPPPDWKSEYRGDTYSIYDLASAVRAKSPYGTLQCSLHPVWVAVSLQHHCGQWRSGIGQQGETVSEFIHGGWIEREVSRLRDENRKLRASLKTARKRSMSRLARLKKEGASP
jgi:hypothetical protein